MAFIKSYLMQVDIKQRMSSPVPLYKQGETSQLLFKVYDNGQLYDLSGYTRSELTFRLPDGSAVVGNGVLNVDNLIQYDFTGVEMAQVGTVKVILDIYSGATLVSTQPFNIHIYDDMKNVDLSYIGILQDLIAEVQLLKDEVTTLINDATPFFDQARQDEDLRVANEITRISSENIRIANENVRKTNETSRISQEITRQNNESAREASELIREQNEQARQSAWSIIEGKVDGWGYEGQHDISKQYFTNNTVTFNGSSFIALQDNLGQQPPTLPTVSNVYWELLAQRGTDGTGAVSSVNGMLPDVSGNVNVDLSTVPTPTLNTNGINFSTTTPNTITQAGQVSYNIDTETLEVGLENGSVLSLGQEQMYHVINQTGSTIHNGTVVMSDGVVGASGKIKVKPAIADGTVPADYIMGLVTHDIINGDTGYVTSFGNVRGINTTGASVSETWVNGDILWAHPTQAGKLTKNKPTSPNVKVMIGIVINSATNGTLLVRPTYGSKFGETDSNVTFSSVLDKDIIQYNSTTGIWENKSITNAGILSSSHENKIASTTELGHVKVDGTTVTIDGNGVISSTGGSGTANLYQENNTTETKSSAIGKNNVSVTEASYAEGVYNLSANGALYNVTAKNDVAKTLTLDTVNGLSVGDLLQIKLDYNKSLTDVPITNISGSVVTVNTNSSIFNSRAVIKKNTIENTTHAEGYCTLSSGSSSHAEGTFTIASGSSSHAEGALTIASGDSSHAEGYGTISNVVVSHAMGQFNKSLTGNSTSFSSTADAFVIGNGTNSSTKSNAFRVTFDGKTYGLSAFNSTGADYAEYFEWIDGNVSNEDRVGYFVTLEGDKIRKALSTDEYILGIVSANPSVIGDSYQDDWSGKYITDEFGRIQYHYIDVNYTEINSEGQEITITKTEYHPQYNPNWDSSVDYIKREDRPEWDAVGLVGKLYVRQDGTVQLNSYVSINDEGKATHSNVRTDYRVIEVVSPEIIRVFVK